MTTITPTTDAAVGEALQRRRSRIAGWLLISALLGFLPIVAMSALSPMTKALHDAAAERGIEYVNGALPLDAYAGVLAANQTPLLFASSVLSLAVWVLFAVAVWRATALRSPLGRASIAARCAAVIAVAAWATMLGLDLLLVIQLGDGLSASYYNLWLGTEAVLSAAAAASILFTVLALDGFASRVLRWVVGILAGIVAIGSFALLPAGGLPPIAAPLLAAVLGIGILVRERRGSRSTASR